MQYKKKETHRENTENPVPPHNVEKVSIMENLRIFDKYWQSKIISDFNGQNVKLAKMKGRFEWHEHKGQDELLMVIKGFLTVKIRDGRDIGLREGEFTVVRRGVNHQLIAEQEVHIFIIEPKATLNTERDPG